MNAFERHIPTKGTGRMKPCHRHDCGNSFYCPPAKDVGGSLPERKYCSNDCFVTYRASPEGISERFWAKVEKTPTCWLFRGCIGHDGYGSFAVGCRENREQYQSNRFAWIDQYGPIPGDLLVLHKCDVRACVRGDHLFLGDRQANMDDKVAKGRQVRGEKMHSAKLTDAKVMEMRRIRATTDLTCDEIGRQFGVSHTVAVRICNGTMWKHVPSYNDAPLRPTQEK